LEYFIQDLEDQIDFLDEDEQAYLSRGQSISYNSQSMETSAVARRLIVQAQEQLVIADSLSQFADNYKRKEKKSMLRQAEALNKKARELNIASSEIVSLQNRAAYREAMVELTKAMPTDISTARDNQAIRLLEMSRTNYDIASENREAAKSSELTVGERESLLLEAINLEKIALGQQRQALAIFTESAASANDTSMQVVRTGEEIPTDIPVVAQNNSVISDTVNTNQGLVNNESNVQQSNANQLVSTNLTVVEVQEMPAQKVLSISENELSPEVRKEVQLKKAEIIGVYTEANSQETYYNQEKPIEIQNELPKGLIYKVQFAAFRSIVDPESFPGMKPISIEQRPNSGWYRYMAGIFTEYNEALVARNNIRQIAYPDAFIVPYFNGERISNARARSLIESGVAFTDAELAQAATSTNRRVYVATSQGDQITQAAATTANDTETINQGQLDEPELFYAVQIGVYGSPRTRARLNNLENLFYDRMDNGYYRYYQGKFASYATASSAQAAVRAAGIRDAFVVAFYQGQKVSVRRARELASQANTDTQTASPQQETSEESTSLSQENTSQVEASNDETSNEDPRPVEQAEETFEVIYKVQLGAFRNNIPINIVNSMLQIALPIDKTLRNDGLTIYTTGSYSSYQEALTIRNQVVQNGIPDAFVVAYINGEQGDLNRARELTGE
jgi:hypothetical protein